MLNRYLTINDLADAMRVCGRTVMRTAKRLRVKATVGRGATVRWSERDAARLLSKWENVKKKK